MTAQPLPDAEEATVSTSQFRGTVGSKYTGRRDVKDVAKDIRRDIRAAVLANELPLILTYSVRISRFSMGQSIDVTIKGFDGDDRGPAACAIGDKVRAIVAAYDRDNCDSLTDYYDVDFYSSVVFGR